MTKNQAEKATDSYSEKSTHSLKERLLQDAYFLSQIISASSTGVLVFNQKLHILFTNSTAQNFLDTLKRPELVTSLKQCSPRCQPDGSSSLKSFLRHLKRAKTGGESSFPWTILDVNNLPFPLQLSLYTLDVLDDNGESLLLLFVRDARGAHDILVDQDKQQATQLNVTLRNILDAAPVCLSLVNERLECVMCNQMAVKLFDLSHSSEYLDNFHALSPSYQPNGRLSYEMAIEKMRLAMETGYQRFYWLHCNLNGDEIPVEVTLVRINEQTEQGVTPVLAGFTNDLRPYLTGHLTGDHLDYYFLNQVPEKVLVNTLTQLSDELFFVFDLRTSYVQFYGKLRESLGLGNSRLLVPDDILRSKVFYYEDVAVFLEVIEKMRKGIDNPIQVRLVGVEGVVRHYEMVYTLVSDKNKTPIFAIGKFADIHEQVLLENQVKLDLLTNCYNKITTETEIKTILQESEKQQHAFFIIDIDNFKAVNDNLGHHFGDLVLNEVATNVKNCFRSHDIVGRIGGDEFIVFVRDLADTNIIMSKAENLVNAFKNSYSGEKGDYKISGSVGIARYPLDGNSYEALYKAADKALYQSKKQGKDCYTFYSKELLSGTMKNRTVLENANRLAGNYFDAQLVGTAFNLLYETHDLRTSINATLKHLGKHLNVDRTYIFESFDDGETYDNTFEWCADGVSPEIENLQGLTKEVLKDFFELATSDGIFFSNDLSVLTAEGAYALMYDQGIKSFLHAQMRRKGLVEVFIGFDDCTGPRVWTEKEINAVMYIGKILSIFLLSERGNKTH